jgi:hypothetical protein
MMHGQKNIVIFERKHGDFNDALLRRMRKQSCDDYRILFECH